MDFQNVKVDKKELGKLIGLGKRAYTTAKKRVMSIQIDQIEDYENELFVEDYTLAKLVKAKQELDKETKAKKEELSNQIIERINKTLVTQRGYDAEELYDKRQGALLQLLKDVHHELVTLNSRQLSTGEEIQTLELGQRVFNIIKDLEGAE